MCEPPWFDVSAVHAGFLGFRVDGPARCRGPRPWESSVNFNNNKVADTGSRTRSVSGPARASRASAAVEALEDRRLLAASIEVTDLSGGVPIPDGDNTPSVEEGTDFGAAPVGSARPFRSFRVTNLSVTDNLTLGSLTVPVGFRLEKGLPDRLDPGASAFFTVSLSDDAQEARAGLVQFATNVPGAEVFDFAIGGAVVPAPPRLENIFDDTPSFVDEDSVSFLSGADSDGLPVAVPVNRLLRFNVPAGEAQVGFTLEAVASQVSEGATADAELLVLPDADAGGELDLSELAAPLTSLVAGADAGPETTQVTLAAGTYFAFLRAANFTVTDDSVDQPGARVDYVLNVTTAAEVEPDVAVTFAGTAVADNDATPSPDEGTNFGSVQVGQPGPERTFNVSSTGGGTLELGAVTVTGPFQLVSGPPATLAAGASAEFVVAMSTASLGSKAGAVSFATNATGKNPFDFALAGNVTQNPPAAAPEVSVSLESDGGALTDGQDAAVDFDIAAQGEAGTTRRFIVRNDGDALLELGEVSVPAGFTLAEPLAAVLAPGESGGFTVSLSTDSAGERSGTVGFATNDADENPFDFLVRGVVTVPGSTPGADITVLLDGTAFTPGQPVDFGSATVGAAGPERTITIRNDGTAPLTLGTVSVPAGYTLAQGPDSTTLAPGASTTVRVTLDTGTVGTIAGEASVVVSDGVNESPLALALTGTVTAPAPLGVSGVTGRVPTVVVAGDRRARGAVAFAIANNTEAAFAGPVTFAAFASDDTRQDASDVQLVAVTRNLKLKAGASRTMRLKFQFPQTIPAGEKNVLVTAAADGTLDMAVGPAVSVQAPFVRLTGLPAAAPAARPLAFGRPARFAVPLQNDGNVPTTKTPATYTLVVSRDETAADELFQTTATGRISLKPGASKPQRLSATFPPGAFAAGSYTLLVRLSAELNQTNGETVALIPFTIA